MRGNVFGGRVTPALGDPTVAEAAEHAGVAAGARREVVVRELAVAARDVYDHRDDQLGFGDLLERRSQPDDANNAAAVSRISVLRVPSTAASASYTSPAIRPTPTPAITAPNDARSAVRVRTPKPRDTGRVQHGAAGNTIRRPRYRRLYVESA